MDSLMNELQIPVGVTTQAWLMANGFEQIIETCMIGGNASSQIFLLSNQQQDKIVAKISTSIKGDVYAKEAHGLNLLTQTKTLRTPEVLHVSDNCLLMEHITSKQQSSNYWRTFASQLADLHRNNTLHNVSSQSKITPEKPRYGLEHSNYCGESPQLNGWFEDGHAFFSEQRLLHQAKLALDNGLLEHQWVTYIESICQRLAELIPEQPPSLLHGDLWSGNVLVDEHGQPALIDPAVYYGWREADIAMTLLLGGLAHDFYLAYDEAWPMETNWRNRVPLYNLYHLLNHLNIFGQSYAEQVKNTIAQYA
ncbi:fructosamine kinase family protein [bacterium]|nr:fructosamine kinase family protein [bacterium]